MKKILFFCLLMLCSFFCFSNEISEFSIDGSPFIGTIECRNVDVKKMEIGKEEGTKVKFYTVDWPNIFFKSKSGYWDWSEYCWLNLKVYNPERQQVQVYVRIDNDGADGKENCITGGFNLPPNKETYFSILLPNHSYPFYIPQDKKRLGVYSKHPLWGMRQSPGNFVEAKGKSLDLSRVVGFQIFLDHPAAPTNLIIQKIELDKQYNLPNFTLPFVDSLGQYKHTDWKGKTHSEREMVENAKKELAQIKGKSIIGKDFDIYGGWKKGPQLKSTGWFRTELINGYWWFVTPDGHLFLSIGVDCVGLNDFTFVEKRENWFEYLPDANDPKFKNCFGYVGKGGHWFGHILEEGRTFCFYKANIIRQFGENWEQPWSEQSIARLKTWGFNTIGAWSLVPAFADKEIPFIVFLGIGNAPRIKNAPGYWGPIYDVFDPQFNEVVEKSISNNIALYKENPFCVGYFVDNELSWDGVWEGTINNDLEQPCKKELIQFCKDKYGTIETLNQSWNTSFNDWTELRKPENETEGLNNDRNDYLLKFADKYFSTVAQAVKKYAPNQLYMGCRFAGFPPKFVWKSAQKYVDVVSLNTYRKEIPREHDLFKITEKPILIGEFHFGALDRGMFHPGLVQCENQKDRAEKYVNYVTSVITNPLFIGCHWFQWADEPITGRYFDGENYNIGLVDVTNSPYREIVKSAQKINKKAYQIRLNESQKSR